MRTVVTCWLLHRPIKLINWFMGYSCELRMTYADLSEHRRLKILVRVE